MPETSAHVYTVSHLHCLAWILCLCADIFLSYSFMGIEAANVTVTAMYLPDVGKCLHFAYRLCRDHSSFIQAATFDAIMRSDT